MTLTLAEQLLLIATNDEKGSLLMAGSTAVPFGIAGALLLELTIAKRLLWQDRRLLVVDHASVDDALADEALDIIASARKARTAEYWVTRIARKIKRIDRRVFEQLVGKGILTQVEKHFLWVIPYQRYPERDPRPEHQVREMLYDTISGRIAPTERVLALLSLVHACGLLQEIVPKGERRSAKKAVKVLLESEPVGKAVSAVVQEINAAVMVAVIAASVASSAASSS